MEEEDLVYPWQALDEVCNEIARKFSTTRKFGRTVEFLIEHRDSLSESERRRFATNLDNLAER